MEKVLSTFRITESCCMLENYVQNYIYYLTMLFLDMSMTVS